MGSTHLLPDRLIPLYIPALGEKGALAHLDALVDPREPFRNLAIDLLVATK